jgi:hypothetical protein
MTAQHERRSFAGKKPIPDLRNGSSKIMMARQFSLDPFRGKLAFISILDLHRLKNRKIETFSRCLLSFLSIHRREYGQFHGLI